MLTDQQAAQYLYRCYTAVDGLWFLKVEETHGLEAALDADDQVWRVLPKIQARMLKAMLKADHGMDALQECLATKLTLDQFGFETQNHGDGFSILVKRCPWHDQMLKSGREHLSGTVGHRICRTEYTVWAAEFGNIRFELQEQICEGCPQCVLRFSQKVVRAVETSEPPPPGN
jgi:predicted ArsR family transcriptional regulator